jgi:hypothetical protein
MSLIKSEFFSNFFSKFRNQLITTRQIMDKTKDLQKKTMENGDQLLDLVIEKLNEGKKLGKDTFIEGKEMGEQLQAEGLKKLNEGKELGKDKLIESKENGEKLQKEGIKMLNEGKEMGGQLLEKGQTKFEETKAKLK